MQTWGHQVPWASSCTGPQLEGPGICLGYTLHKLLGLLGNTHNYCKPSQGFKDGLDTNTVLNHWRTSLMPTWPGALTEMVPMMTLKMRTQRPKRTMKSSSFGWTNKLMVMIKRIQPLLPHVRSGDPCQRFATSATLARRMPIRVTSLNTCLVRNAPM